MWMVLPRGSRDHTSDAEAVCHKKSLRQDSTCRCTSIMLKPSLLSGSWRAWAPGLQKAARLSHPHRLMAHTHHVPAEVITSPANDFIKHCVKLRSNSKYRQMHGQFMLTGLTALREAAGCQGGRLHARVLFIPSTQQDEHSDWLTADRVVRVSESVLKKLSGLESVTSIQAVAQMDAPPMVDLQHWGRAPAGASGAAQRGEGRAEQARHSTKVDGKLLRLLALEGVQDPGNIGTLIRSALAFGWDAVWLLPNCCDPFNEKAIRASRGAVLRTAIAAGTLSELLKVCDQHSLRLVAAEPDDSYQASSTHNQGSSPSGVCLVMGSEGQGISQEVLKACQTVAIPMAGNMESLNVGVAGGILMLMLSRGGPTQLTQRLSQLQLSHLWSADQA